MAAGGSTAAALDAWIVFEDEAGFAMTPPRARTWGRRGQTPVVRVRGRSRRRISVAAMCCYIAGTNVAIDNPGGDGAEPLFEWIHNLASWRQRQGMTGGEENRDSELMREWFDATGAVVMGRMMYDTGEEFWGDNPPFRVPVFVLTHRPRPTLVKEGGTTFAFVTDGIRSALDQAMAAAGDGNVDIAGGASTQQYLGEGLIGGGRHAPRHPPEVPLREVTRHEQGPAPGSPPSARAPLVGTRPHPCATPSSAGSSHPLWVTVWAAAGSGILGHSRLARGVSAAQLNFPRGLTGRKPPGTAVGLAS